MALQKEKLKQDIKALLAELVKSEDQNKSMNDFAGGLADIIDAYIKTATVNTTVTGICPSGAVTGKGTGGLS